MKKTITFIFIILFLFNITISNLIYKAEGTPFKADLENLWKYNIGAGNVSDIGYDYDKSNNSVRLYLDGNVSGYSPLEFNIEVDIDSYPMLEFEISDCSIFWALKIADNNTGGADYAFYGDDRPDNIKFSHDMRKKANYVQGIDESDAFPGYSGVHVFKLKIYIVDKAFTGGSLTLKGLQISTPGYTGEYNDGIKLNDKPTYLDNLDNGEYLRRREYMSIFEDIDSTQKIVTGVNVGLRNTIYVVLGLNIVLFVFFFFKLVYPRLKEEHDEKIKGDL
jgi:hypothetical protein